MSQQPRTFNSAEGRIYLYKGVGKGGINSKTQNIDICNVHAADIKETGGGASTTSA